jgi:hypothetical protein
MCRRSHGSSRRCPCPNPSNLYGKGELRLQMKVRLLIDPKIVAEKLSMLRSMIWERLDLPLKDLKLERDCGPRNVSVL